jgi:hypothetical protein
MTRSISLKTANLGWLWAVIALDAIVTMFIVDPKAVSAMAKNEFLWMRASLAAAAPVVVLLLSSLLSSRAKEILVFWRRKDVLPGHRAFTLHAPRDSRIDLDLLQKNVGKWPDEPPGQNKMWFKLYKKVENDVPVLQAHKAFLLFRDLAVLSLLLAPVALIGIGVLKGTTWSQAILALAIFLLQYGACVVAARNAAHRFVCNVLCAHSVKRRTA